MTPRAESYAPTASIKTPPKRRILPDPLDLVKVGVLVGAGCGVVVGVVVWQIEQAIETALKGLGSPYGGVTSRPFEASQPR